MCFSPLIYSGKLIVEKQVSETNHSRNENRKEYLGTSRQRRINYPFALKGKCGRV